MSATQPPGAKDVFSDLSDERRDPSHHPLGRHQPASKPASLQIAAKARGGNAAWYPDRTHAPTGTLMEGMVCDLVAYECMVQRLGRVNRRGGDELSDGTKLATIDSVGAQANRMEPVFLAARDG